MDRPTERNDEQFEITLLRNRIVLHGDLDDSPRVPAVCRAALEKVGKFSSLIVEADDARVVPEGVTIWIEAVDQFLSGCELIYAPSQLRLILEYDERYRHPKTIFEDWGFAKATTAAGAA